MKRTLEKMVNMFLILGIISIVVFIIFFIIQFKEMLNDYRCSQLPINEFFQDKKCERYWRYRND